MAGGPGSSLLRRLLGATFLLFVIAVVLRAAVTMILSVLWPLVGLAAAVVLAAVAWQVWRSRGGGW
jgi:hypothetical protein